jgi:parvulin-like peptidyl-prolyl isomerase
VNARQGLWIVAVAGIGLSSLQALAQGPAGAPPRPGAAKPAIATVGTHHVTREEWERRSAVAIAEFSRRNGNAELPAEMRDLVRRQVLEGQIRFEMLALEARRTGVTASATEAEAILKQDPFFNPGGRFDETRFITVKTTQVAAYNSAIASLEDQLAARKLNERLEAKFRPAEPALRAGALRALSRATLDHLSLRRSDFNGTFPEPRESEVLGWYAAHQADFRRPDRATLTVAFVNSPGLSDSIRSLPGGAERWAQQMKSLADSILGEVRKGATLDKAAGFLGPRSNTVVAADNFPGYWRASDAENRQLFDPRNVGKVLPEALPSVEGWLVVRVDEVAPEHVAPLREVAREIRGVLRKDRRQNHELYEQRALYDRIRDDLAAPGWRFRWALADTAAQAVPAPTDAEIDAWYRGHLADYSAFDSKSGSIVTRPLGEVKAEVRSRWTGERRRLEARVRADALFKTWSAGRGDPALESALHVRETAALVHGAVVDSGEAARALADTLWSYEDPHGPGLMPTRSGWIVWKLAARVDRAVPTFEQARDLVADRLATAKTVEEETGAKRLFQANPGQFGGGDVIHFSRFTIPEMPVLKVKLTRAEVERYHREHIDKFSAPELVTARHILITPASETPEAVHAARARADEVLRRAKAGEDFARLAREYSDDAATKDKGGDLGTFGRGTMMNEFEREVFSLTSAELVREPFRTPLGWHVVYCTEHVPAVIQPLDWVYTTVAGEAAAVKAERLAQQRADSIVRASPTPAAARAAAAKLGETVYPFTKKVGEASPATLTRAYYEALDRCRPGQVVPTSFHLKGQGNWISWVDSISPPTRPTWEEARTAAVEAYRRGAGQRALDAKKAELDSLFSAGWSLDSAATLWGGLEHLRDAQPGRGLPSMGGGSTLDSMVVGGARSAVLGVGSESGWVEFPNGWSRLRLVNRQQPSAEQLAVRMENDRAAAIERGMLDYFGDLRRRYPVNILDPKMREMATAGPPPASTP